MTKKITAILALSAISAFCAPDFTIQKAKVLQNVERESAALTEAKLCIEEAQNSQALKVCIQKAKAAHKEIWARPSRQDTNSSK